MGMVVSVSDEKLFHEKCNVFCSRDLLLLCCCRPASVTREALSILLISTLGARFCFRNHAHSTVVPSGYESSIDIVMFVSHWFGVAPLLSSRTACARQTLLYKLG